MNISIPSDAIHHPQKLPSPKAAIGRLPVVIRERMAAVPMPVQYEEACRALIACATIDEGKQWADKSDALAAWAKIYKSDEAAVAARRLKLQAFRRMGELAEEMRPPRQGNLPGQKGSGCPPGAHALLKESGLTVAQATNALRLKRTPAAMFDEFVKRGVGLNVVSVASRGLSPIRTNRAISSDSWNFLCRSTGGALGAQLTRARGAFRKRTARDVAAGIAPGEVKAARALVTELMEWLDEFEQYLPKEK